MARYYENEPRRPRRSLLETLAYLFTIGIIVLTGFLAWPLAQARLAGQLSTLPLPTAFVAPPARPLPARPSVPEQPAIAPQDAIADYNATAEAQYQEAIQQQPQPNVNTTGDTAPLQYVSKPAERQPAGDNVPTAEPIQPSESNDQFGSKPAKPINIQETRTCLHGQIWTERGCKNPTPVR